MFLPLLCIRASGIPRRSSQREHSLHLAGFFVRALIYNLVDIDLRDTHTVPASPPTP